MYVISLFNEVYRTYQLLAFGRISHHSSCYYRDEASGWVALRCTICGHGKPCEGRILEMFSNITEVAGFLVTSSTSIQRRNFIVACWVVKSSLHKSPCLTRPLQLEPVRIFWEFVMARILISVSASSRSRVLLSIYALVVLQYLCCVKQGVCRRRRPFSSAVAWAVNA